MLHGFIIRVGINTKVMDLTCTIFQRCFKDAATHTGDPMDHAVGFVTSPASLDVGVSGIIPDGEHEHAADPICFHHK